MAATVSSLRSKHAPPGSVVEFQFDGVPMVACAGETIAASLLAVGIRDLGTNPEDGSPRGLFCAMGVCQECVVLVDGARVEACRTIVREGMMVRRAA